MLEHFSESNSTAGGEISPEDISAFLKRNAPFSELDQTDLDWLISQLRSDILPAGKVVLHPGEQPTDLIFLVSGLIKVEAMGAAVPEDRRLIAEISAGECFPVEALHEIRPVFAVYRANEDLQILKLRSEAFQALKERSPLFKQYCEDRASAYLVSTKRIFEAHFGRRATNTVTLESPLSSLRLRLPQMCPPDTPVISVAKMLAESGELSIVVVNSDMHPLGVFSLRDLIRRVLLVSGDLNLPISEVMTVDLVTLPPEVNGYEAAQAMAEHGLPEILVVDRGHLKGVVSERDLFAAQHLALGQLAARIRRAGTIGALAVLARENWNQAKRLMEQGLASEPLTRILSSLNDRLADRVLEICKMEQGQALPDFCWIALGSEGRQEQTLSTDQDNGIVFADQADNESTRQLLLQFAERVNHALAECGIPLCKGGIMASNPQWCLPLSEWKQKFSYWIEKPGPEEILNATIFFDFRAVYGNDALAETLKAWLLDALSDQHRFFINLSTEALKRAPPLGTFRDFAVEAKGDHAGTIDLKLSGVTLFVDAARVLGLKSGCKDSCTSERLRHAGKAMRINSAEAEAWIAAFHFIQMLRLRNQYQLIEAGEKPHNRIDPYKLNEMDRKVLIESMKQAKRLQKRLEAITA